MRSGLPVCSIDARMASQSGIGVYLRNILVELAKCSDVRLQVLARRNDFGLLDTGDGLCFTAVDSPIYSIAEQIELPRSVSDGASCIWSPHYNMPLFTRIRRLVTVHDIAHLAEPTINGRLLPRLYAKSMLSSVRLLADTVFFVSRFTEAEFARVIGSPRGTSAITPNAAAPHWTGAAGPVGSTANPARPYFIFVGNVKPHKNLVGLLHAMRHLEGEGLPDLLVIGRREGFFHADLAASGIAATLGDRVRFAGELSDAAVVDAVRGAVALIQPSFYEGFGIPPLEAMAVGTPVLASDIPVLRETCGPAALYFDPRDPSSIAAAMRSVARDPEISARLSSYGHNRHREFSFKSSAETVLSAILAAAAKR